MIQLAVTYLAYIKPWMSYQALHKLGMVIYIYNPSTQKVEAQGSEDHSQPLGYMSPCLKNKPKKKKKALLIIEFKLGWKPAC